MQTITFYSYKGGSCRSVTLLNVLPFLVEVFDANALEPILVVDMDLDSAGITALLQEDTHFQSGFDVKSLLSDGFPGSNTKCANLRQHPFFQHTVPVGERVGVDNDSILFLGTNDSKVLSIDDIGGANIESIRILKQACRANGFKAIVLDSASGDQVPAKISTTAASTIVCCLRPTRQFRTYTFQYLRRLKNRIPDDTKVIVLPTAVPTTDLPFKKSSEKENSLSLLQDHIAMFNKDERNCLIDNFVFNDHFGIPEVEKFKWREDVLYKLHKKFECQLSSNDSEPVAPLRPDEKIALNRYQEVSQLIRQLGN